MWCSMNKSTYIAVFEWFRNRQVIHLQKVCRQLLNVPVTLICSSLCNWSAVCLPSAHLAMPTWHDDIDPPTVAGVSGEILRFVDYASGSHGIRVSEEGWKGRGLFISWLHDHGVLDIWCWDHHGSPDGRSLMCILYIYIYVLYNIYSLYTYTGIFSIVPKKDSQARTTQWTFSTLCIFWKLSTAKIDSVSWAPAPRWVRRWVGDVRHSICNARPVDLSDVKNPEPWWPRTDSSPGANSRMLQGFGVASGLGL